MQRQSGSGGAGAMAPVPEAETKPARAEEPQSAPRPAAEGRPVSANIVWCADGKYRWLYRMNLLKNPTVFLLVWKIFFFILLGVFAVTALADQIRWGFDVSSMLGTLKVFGLFVLGMTALVGLGCLV